MGQRVYMEHNGVQLLAPVLPGFERILTREALSLVGELTRTLRPSWKELMQERVLRQERIDAGELPDFDPETREIREDASWEVKRIPPRLLNRQVEVVCPAGNRKMLLGALNAKSLGANITLGCLEDANGCQWGPGGTIDALNNLYDAARGELDFQHHEKGRQTLDGNHGYLMVRPRGLHFVDPRYLVDGEPVPAIIPDIAFHLFHNGSVLLERGKGPDLYLAKLESGAEADWCNDLIQLTELDCGLTLDSAKVSVLYEHILGLFQIEEITYALRHRFTAGNTGWLDYLASLSRTFRRRADYVMPDPGQVTIRTPSMRAYLDLVVRTMHKRGALAIGGTATQVGISGDEVATERARQAVRANAEPYAAAGFDGGWVVYAPFVPVVRDVFRGMMGEYLNQLAVLRQGTAITREQLLAPPPGTRTLEGLDECITGGVEYEAGWLTGTGAVAITYRNPDGSVRTRLMEDAATAERKREDVWKWLSVGAKLADGRTITSELVWERMLVWERLDRMTNLRIRQLGGDAFEAGRYDDAFGAFWEQVRSERPPEYFPPELLKLIWAEETRRFSGETEKK